MPIIERILATEKKMQLKFLNVFYTIATGVKVRLYPAASTRYPDAPMGKIKCYVLHPYCFFSYNSLMNYIKKKNVKSPEQLRVVCYEIPVKVLGKTATRAELEPWIKKLRRNQFFFKKKKERRTAMTQQPTPSTPSPATPPPQAQAAEDVPREVYEEAFMGKYILDLEPTEYTDKEA